MLRIQMLLCLSLLAPAFIPPAAAAKFPPLTAEERALTAVPGHPEAPAVVLSRRGDLDLVRHQLSTTLQVESRLKILTEKGKEEYGEIEILHSRWVRLRNLEGRTVLPDGSEVALDESSVFERRASRSRRLQVTAIAFPALEVGAVVDYRYQLYFDSIYFLEPWIFQEEIPVLHSEITYRIPKELSARAWSRDPMQAGIHTEQTKSAIGLDLKVWSRNLPPIPDEPLGFPAVDLATRFLLVPVNYGGRVPLLETWRSTCGMVEEQFYTHARRNNTAARRLAGKLAQGAKSPEEKARAFYRYVRDEIETVPWPSVLIGEKEGPDRVIADRRGDYATKAFLLHSLLDAAKIEADLVWAASRQDGLVDLEVPSFGWFDRMLVRAHLGGEPVFLDPSAPGLAFGRLAADYEGTSALLFHPRKPEVITLPASSFEEHERRAEVALTLDEEGRLSGSGTLTLSGHHAARRIAAMKESGEKPEETWSDWLEERYPGFEVGAVAMEQALDQGRLAVTWTLAQRPEEVLGDEATLLPSRPLGPAHQRLTLPSQTRRTPVMLDFPDCEVVELSLSWPAGWGVEVEPEERSHRNGAGALATSLERGEDGRSLVYQRRLEVHRNQFMGPDDYSAAQALFGAAEKNDAQILVLARR